MSAVKHTDILFRTGGVTTLRYGRPFIGYRRDGSEPSSYTFTRADSTTCATYVDADGNVRTAASGKLRLSYVDTALAGTWDACGLLLESSRVNLCLQSQNFGTTWVAAGTPTRSAAAATCGIVDLDLIGDDDAAGQEYYSQNITFTADAVKAVSLFVKKGTSAAAGGSEIVLNDTTASSVKLDAVITWSGSVPSVAIQSSKGTLLRTVRLAGDVYRLEFQTLSVTAANTNNLAVYPVSVTNQTGNLYAGGVQCENGSFSTSYIKTTTATVTRAADQLSFPRGFGLSDMTVYAKIARPPWADASGSLAALDDLYLFQVATGPPTFNLPSLNAARTVSCYGSGATAATASLPAGSTISLCGQVTSLSSGAQSRLDVGSGFGSYTSAGSAYTSWGSTETDVYVGRRGATAYSQINGLVIDVIVARGLFTLAEMAACPTP